MKKLLFGKQEDALRQANTIAEINGGYVENRLANVGLSDFQSEEGAPDSFSGETNAYRVVSLNGDVIAYVAYWDDSDTKTYDVRFNDSENSNSKGFQESIDYCKNYIQIHNGTNDSYFSDYKGGSVSVVCNETGEVVYSEAII